MEPFHITCVTCQARLKVSSAAAIGQIVACPRCESMVHVTAPPEPPVPDEPGAPPPDPKLQDPRLQDPRLASLPGAQMVPMETASRRVALWIATGACLLIATVIALAAWWRADPEPVAASSRDENVAGTVVDKPAPNVPKETLPDSPPDPLDESEDDVRAEPPEGDPPASETPAADIEQDPLFPPAIGAPDPPAVDVVVPKPSAPTNKVRQAILDGLADVDGPAAAPNPNVDVEPESPIEPERAAPPTAHVTMQRAPAPQETAQPEDLLGMRLQAISAEGLTLASAIQLIHGLTAQPITIDAIELEIAGVSPSVPVKLDAADVTAGAALRGLLEPLGLGYRIEGNHVFVEAIERPDQQQTYDIDDLLGGDPPEQFTAWLEQLVCPRAWQVRGGEGFVQTQDASLLVTQSATAQHELDLFLERLRVARGIKPRGTAPAWLVDRSESDAQLQARLAEPLTFTIGDFTTLPEVQRQWQRLTGLTILVDWSALGALGITAQSRIRCSAIEQPLGESLDAILGQLELSWQPLDAQTIQISSLRALTSTPARTELIRLASGVAKPHLPQRLKDQTEQQFGADIAALVHFYFDEPSNHLVVSAPPRVQRFVRSQLSR